MSEQVQNPNQHSPEEQQFREQMLNQIEAESAGTVALYTHMPVTEAQKASMIEIQSARGGVPSEALTSLHGRGGWGQFGERLADSGKVDEGESVAFVPLEDGKVDVRYGFTRHTGYNDEHGRPGNKLQLQFILPSASAGELREALQADPSFINDVVKRQVAAIGIDTADPNGDWKNRLEPHYYDRSTFTIMPDKDRVLNIRDTDATGENIVAEEALTYGENKSLLSLSPEAQSAEATQASEVQPSPTAETYEPAVQIASDEAQQELVQSTLKFWTDGYTAMEAEGKTAAEILDDIESSYADLVDYRREAESRGSATEVAESKAVLEALDTLHARYQEATRKEEVVSSARDSIASVHAEIAASAPTESAPKLNGEAVAVTERYNDASGTEWVVVNGQRHIQASQLDK